MWKHKLYSMLQYHVIRSIKEHKGKRIIVTPLSDYHTAWGSYFMHSSSSISGWKLYNELYWGLKTPCMSLYRKDNGI